MDKTRETLHARERPASRRPMLEAITERAAHPSVRRSRRAPALCARSLGPSFHVSRPSSRLIAGLPRRGRRQARASWSYEPRRGSRLGADPRRDHRQELLAAAPAWPPEDEQRFGHRPRLPGSRCDSGRGRLLPAPPRGAGRRGAVRAGRPEPGLPRRVDALGGGADARGNRRVHPGRAPAAGASRNGFELALVPRRAP